MSHLLFAQEAVLQQRSWAGISRQLERCLQLAAAGVLPATLLLVGDPGLGREALAIQLAAGLVCRKSPQSWCSCPCCERVYRGTHPDVAVIEVLPGKTEISIDQARELAETLPQRPFEGLRRVFVVSSCQTPPLSTEAASALLKVLEEPPRHASILLLATNPARVLPTVVSRAVQLRVSPPSQAELEAALGALLSTTPDQSAALLHSCQGDAWLALATPGPEPQTVNRALRELAQHALAGDGLALLQLAALIKRLEGGTGLAVAALLGLARTLTGDAAEAPLDAAAAVLTAARKQESLHLDLEATVTGALAPLVRR